MDSIDVWIKDFGKTRDDGLSLSPSVDHLDRLLTTTSLNVNGPSSYLFFSDHCKFVQNCGLDGVRKILEHGRDINKIRGSESDTLYVIGKGGLSVFKSMLPYIDFSCSVASHGRFKGLNALEASLLYSPTFAYEIMRETSERPRSETHQSVMTVFLLSAVKSKYKNFFILNQIWNEWGREDSLENVLSQLSDEEKQSVKNIINFVPQKKQKQKNQKALPRPFRGLKPMIFKN